MSNPASFRNTHVGPPMYYITRLLRAQLFKHLVFKDGNSRRGYGIIGLL